MVKKYKSSLELPSVNHLSIDYKLEKKQLTKVAYSFFKEAGFIKSEVKHIFSDMNNLDWSKRDSKITARQCYPGLRYELERDRFEAVLNQLYEANKILFRINAI